MMRPRRWVLSFAGFATVSYTDLRFRMYDQCIETMVMSRNSNIFEEAYEIDLLRDNVKCCTMNVYFRIGYMLMI